MKRFLFIAIFILAIAAGLRAIPARAEAVEGCVMKRLIGEVCDAYNTAPFIDEYCGDVAPDGFGCCCSYEAQVKINSGAADEKKKPVEPSIFTPPKLSVLIPGLKDFTQVNCDDLNTNCSIPWLGQYIAGLQRYALGIIGIIAVIVLMIAGVMWLTAGGSGEQLNQAKSLMKGAVVGLVIAFAAYLILYTINPNLTVMKNINIGYIAKEDLDEILVAIKEGEPITKDQAELMGQFDQDGIISHTVGKSANTYKGMSCNKSNFANGQSVEFFTTGYYKPPYENSQKFFCDVGLQCSCPAGSQQIGPNKGLCKHSYKYCSPFSSTTPYCTNTASGIPPEIGHIAADGACFNFGDKICLGGKITLTVTDRGSAIKGRRFDIFSGTDRQAALGKTGVVSVKLGACP